MDLTPGARRRTRIRTIGIAASLVALSTGTGVALAGSGGGGLTTPDPPVIRDVRCLQGCLDLRTATQGGRAELIGRDLEAAVSIKVPGAAELAPAKAVEPGSVEFVVPKGSETGKPIVIDSYGNKSRSPVELEIGPSSKLDDTDGFAVRSATVSPRKSYYGGKRRSTVEYLFEADAPTDVRIDVLKGRAGKVVDTIVAEDAEPFTNLSTAWNGKTASGDVAPNGKYRFEIAPVAGGGSPADAGFQFHDHKFPLRGSHNYGDGLGAGRNHQGVDVFAKCGTPIVAARGGKVQASEYHASAGNYVVIDGVGTRVDYAYMHLNPRGLPSKGDRVRTGERIGYEDDTGNAQGCHLHFEMWSAPGWYEGGSPLDPEPALKKWDRWS